MLIKTTIDFLHLTRRNLPVPTTFSPMKASSATLPRGRGGERALVDRLPLAVDLPLCPPEIQLCVSFRSGGTIVGRTDGVQDVVNPINALDYLDYYAAMPFPTINYNYLSSPLLCLSFKVALQLPGGGNSW